MPLIRPPGRRTARAEEPALVEPVQDRVADLVGRLSAEPGTDGPESRRGRARLIAQLSAALTSSARTAGAGAVASGRWLADLVEQIAPYVTIRDLSALQDTYRCEGDALAAAVVRSASHSTAALGAAAGALAAAELAAPPALMATPVQLAAETLAVVAVELRMLGELHEIYGVPLEGSPTAKAGALVTTWVRRRALEPGAGTLFLGAAARRELRKRVLKRLGGSVTTLAPFLAGAVAGAEINRRETRKLGESVSRDLRTHALHAFPPERLVEGHLADPRPTGGSPG